MKKLTDANYWQKTWGNSKRNVKFCPIKPSFIHFHRLFQKYLPRGSCSFIEVGCFPGQYLWYFEKHFGYKVSGIELLANKVEYIRQACLQEGVNTEIISGDFFSYHFKKKYDIVGSFGFIEHFENPASVVHKHIEITKPGGYIVITAPNHASPLYEKLLLLSGEDCYKAHNRMSFGQLLESVRQENNISIIAAGYCGHFGLGYTGGALTPLPKLIKLVTRVIVFALGIASKIIPNNKLLSQAMYVIIKKNVYKGRLKPETV